MLNPVNPTTEQFTRGLRHLQSKSQPTAALQPAACNIVLGWHGTPASRVHSVVQDLPRNFRTMGGGFFGAGSYFALECRYAMRCSLLAEPDPATRHFAVILFALRIGAAYVVTRDDYPGTDPEHPQLDGFSRFYSANPEQVSAGWPYLLHTLTICSI